MKLLIKNIKGEKFEKLKTDCGNNGMLPKMLQAILRGFTSTEFEEEAREFFTEHPFPEGIKQLHEGKNTSVRLHGLIFFI